MSRFKFYVCLIQTIIHFILLAIGASLDFFFFVIGDVIISEQAKRARHYQGCTNSSWCYMYGGMCAK